MRIAGNVKQLQRRDWALMGTGAIAALACAGIVTLIQHAQVPLRPEARGITSPWIPSTVKRWEQPIDEMAKKYNIDPNLLAIIMTLESGGYSKAGSEADAKGLMQITPPTAKDIAAKHLKEPRKKYDLFDPQTSIEFGAAYMEYNS